MSADPFVEFKAAQKESWGLFLPLEIMTVMPAATLVNFSHLTEQNTVLDVACGTGVVSVTAAKKGAKVSALDLSPVLLERAQANADIAQVNVEFREGDAESLPYADNTFDVVLSQFGHMFAPRPQIAINEMLRVLKPGGTIAFSTWPPDLFVGRVYDLVRKFSPPPPGIPSPSCWGEPHYVRKQLGTAVEDITFDQGLMRVMTLSLGHYQRAMEKTLGSIVKLVKDAEKNSTQLNQFRAELNALTAQYYEDNCIYQHFLMTRAKKLNTLF